MTRKRRKRKSKQTGKHESRYPPMSAKMQKLAQAGYLIRVFEIVDDSEDNYKQGIPGEISEAIGMVKTGRLDEAKTAFQHIIEREPRAKEAYVNLAAIYVKMGDEETAEALFRETIDKFPRYILPRSSMALMYLQRGQDDQAEAIMRPLDDLEQFTSAEFRLYILTWSDIYAHQRHFKTALSWLRLLQKMPLRSRGVWERRIIYWIGRIFREKRGER